MNNGKALINHDKEAIKQLIASADLYQNDIDSFIPLHTDDVIIVNFVGRRVIGKEAFHLAMNQALDSPLSKVFTKIEISDIHFISADVAIVSCIKHVFDERNNLSDDLHAGLASSGNLTYLVVKTQDKWQITFAQTTPIK